MIPNNSPIRPVKLHPKNSWLAASGYTLDNEQDIYDELLQAVYDNPRWFLDHAEKLPQYRLSWIDYGHEKISVPYRHRQKTSRRKAKSRLDSA